jgi:D-alanyl-D-alanine dipeptidase
VLYILEHRGQLYALIEWFFFYPLKETGENEFAFPNYGLYHGEKLYFHRGDDGVATRVVAAEVKFDRRPSTADGETFKIKPLKPIEELRKVALAASPPAQNANREPDLVDVTTIDKSIRLDIRYATENNFMGSVFYKQPRAFLQRPAAEALGRVQKSLAEHGYGLLIHDAYRPWFVTKMFWDATPAEMKDFVANPASGSRHNRGCAVDLTLYDLKTGKPVQMVAGYDEFSSRAFPLYPGGTSRQRWLRDLLRLHMQAEGFSVYQYEWWHFDYRDWREYPLLNKRFEQLKSR